jgi:hypothetical protein
MDFARKQPGITKVVLLGHSGGSPLMSLYQGDRGKRRGLLPEAGADGESARTMSGTLTPADGLVFPDAHPGNPAQAVRGINPSPSIVNGKVSLSIPRSIPSIRRTATIRKALRIIRRNSRPAITRRNPR